MYSCNLWGGRPFYHEMGNPFHQGRERRGPFYQEKGSRRTYFGGRRRTNLPGEGEGGPILPGEGERNTNLPGEGEGGTILLGEGEEGTVFPGEGDGGTILSGEGEGRNHFPSSRLNRK